MEEITLREEIFADDRVKMGQFNFADEQFWDKKFLRERKKSYFAEFNSADTAKIREDFFP